MQRTILAVSAFVLLLTAVVLNIWWPQAEVVLSCCWRGGAILAAAWLAYDDVQRLPNWLLLTLPIVVIVLVRWSKLALLFIPALIAYGVLRRLFATRK